MKRLIIFLLLFAAIKVAGQTTGYLRFDTVMIYKVGGTAELVLMNKTKDSLGILTNYGNGRTRFIKSRAINDSTIVVGLDTFVIRGAPPLTASRIAFGGFDNRIAEDGRFTYDSSANKLTVDARANLNKAVSFRKTSTGDANYSITDNDFYIELSTTTTNRTITFPSAGGDNTGRMLWIANRDGSSNEWVISGTVTDVDLSPEEGRISFGNTLGSFIIISDGTFWVVQNKFPEVDESGSGGGIGQVVADYGVINVNDSTLAVDTPLISTRAWRQKGDDSVAAVLRGVINDTADAIRGDFPATPTLQQVTTAGNTTTVTIIPDSIRAIRVQSDTLYTFLQPYTADTIYFFGDSYTTGSNATSPSLRYSTLLAARLGLVEKNLGMSGSTLMKRTPVDPYGSVNMIDRLHEIPTYGPLKKYIIIAYGFNDMGVNNANYTPPNFRIDYQQVMDTILARGWPAHRVILISPWYASQATYTGYAGTTGTPANNRTRHLEFIDTAQATATANGARFVNVFNAQIINDSLQLFYLDNIHPGNDGHQIIAQTIYTYITDTVTKNGQTLAVNGNAEFQNIFYKNIDTVSRYAPVLGIGFDGKIGMFASQRIIKDRSILESQAGNVNMVGKGLFGGVTPANAVEEETLMASGGIKGTWVRANGNLPSLASDSAVEIGLLSATNGYIGAFNRRTGTALGLSVNGLGGNVAVGTTTFTGANRLQVNGNASVSTGFYAGGTTTPTAKIHIAASNGGVSTGPLKLTIGTDLATAEAGVMEYGALSAVNRLAFTPTGTTRLRVPLINDITPAAGSIIQGNGSNFTQLAIGTANQQLRVNAGATALEYFTPSGGSDGNGIYSGSGSLPGDVTVSGAGHILNLGTSGSQPSSFSAYSSGNMLLSASSGNIFLEGGLQLNWQLFTDGDGALSDGRSGAILPAITANRTFTFPSTGTNKILYIINDNTSGNTWNTNISFQDKDGSTLTSFANTTNYMLRYTGSVWRILLKY